MPSPQNPSGNTARERVLQAAIDVFSSRGFEATIAGVAKAAGVNEITIYRLYRNKKTLQSEAFYAVASHSINAYLEGVLKRDEVPPLLQSLPEMAELFAHSDNLCFFRMVLWALLENHPIARYWEENTSRPRMLTLLRSYVMRLQERDARYGNLDPTDAARALAGILIGAGVRDGIMKNLDVASPNTRKTTKTLLAMLPDPAV